MKFRMKNKLVLVTGGSRGIGKSIVIKLAEIGYDVAFTYKKNLEVSKSICNNLNNRGFNVKCFHLLLDNYDNISNCVNEIQTEFKKSISILINNAAVAQEKDFESISFLDWDIMLKTNLQGPFHLTQLLIPSMINNSFGKIVNITSIGGQWGGFNQVHYAASKAGLISLTMSTAKIYSKHNINCNAIAVGLVQTDMTTNELSTKNGIDKVKNIPIGRIGTTNDVAETVNYLISEESSYITGQTINLNGGMYFG
jgi:acetoacetyl-CoA reductase/3-oxoacyl-[acyl-carrier protein] reductase